jgi:hypothetical protein
LINICSNYLPPNCLLMTQCNNPPTKGNIATTMGVECMQYHKAV